MLKIAVSEQAAIGLEDFVARFEAARFDTSDPASLIEAAALLSALARDREFLTALVIRELETDLVYQRESNGYSPEVIMLSKSEDFLIRANLWPSATDEIYRQNRPESFFYNVPHDHNFNLLTVGYLAPGYESDDYDYDHECVAGYPQEPVRLRFRGRSRLEEGDVALYRAGRDVHSQLPPEAPSVSLNVVDASPHVFFREQYLFDDELGSLRCIIGLRCNPALFTLAAMLGGEEAQDRLLRIHRDHDSGFVAMQALKARPNRWRRKSGAPVAKPSPIPRA